MFTGKQVTITIKHKQTTTIPDSDQIKRFRSLANAIVQFHADLNNT